MIFFNWRMYFDDSLVYLLCLACQKKLVDKSSYGVSLSIEIQKYYLSHHLLTSVSFIAEVTSDVEADNWSGRFFSQTQQRPKLSVLAHYVYCCIKQIKCFDICLETVI